MARTPTFYEEPSKEVITYCLEAELVKTVLHRSYATLYANGKVLSTAEISEFLKSFFSFELEVLEKQSTEVNKFYFVVAIPLNDGSDKVIVNEFSIVRPETVASPEIEAKQQMKDPKKNVVKLPDTRKKISGKQFRKA